MILTTLTGGRGRLETAAAASLARIDAALGHVMQITEAWRDPARADRLHAEWVAAGSPIGDPEHPIALSGSQSIHCQGRAIDTDEGQQHTDLLAEHGWTRTVYRDGKLVEPWHYEYAIARDQHLTDPTPALMSEEDEDMPKLVQMPNKEKDVFAIAHKSIVHIGNMADLTAATKTCGPLITCNDREFRDALIVRHIPYDKARAGVKWAG